MQRALAAARAKFAAGAPDAACELLAMAELGRLDELQRAELARQPGSRKLDSRDHESSTAGITKEGKEA